MKKVLIVIGVIIVSACSSPPKSESWDQENLKKNDHGCPTAIFIAPGGELKQCES